MDATWRVPGGAALSGTWRSSAGFLAGAVKKGHRARPTVLRTLRDSNGRAGRRRGDERAGPLPALRAVPVCEAGAGPAKAAAKPPFLRRPLADLRAALRSEADGALSGVIRKNTGGARRRIPGHGPVQFAIFESVFGRGETALFLIGDRSRRSTASAGRSFAYIRAASFVKRRYTLTRTALEPGSSARQHPVLPGGEPVSLHVRPYGPAGWRRAEGLPADGRGRREAPFRLWAWTAAVAP